MNYLELLKQLAQKAGQNLDKSNEMVKQQVDVAGKQVDNPEYKLSPEEEANQDEYYKSLAGAVSGSIAPINKGLGVMGKAKEARNVANEIYDQAIKNAQEGVSGVGVDMNALRKAQQALSRNIDAEDRLKFQKLKRALGK